MEEREINLIDMIADILSHWRGILICMLAGAILMGSFGAVKAYKELREAVAAVKQLQENPEGAEAESLQEPAFQWGVCVKKAVTGAFLLAFVYAGYYFVMYILNGRLRSVDELQKLYHIPQFGLIVQEKETPKNKIDQRIDALRNWNKRRLSREQSVDLTATAIRISARKQELDTICLAGCNLEAGADVVCQALKERLENEKIKVKILNNILYDSAMMGELEDVKGVVLVEKAMTTLYDEVARELELISRQKIDILGGVIVE